MHTPNFRKRSRLASLGVATIAAALAGAAAAAWTATAAPGDDDGTFVPITPCRLFDDRPTPHTVGPVDTPLAAGADRTQQITGSIGDCAIPGDAVAIAMNVTIANPTAQSNLRLWPADQPKPEASNLNWIAGQSPTPNKVDVQLSPTGAIQLANHNGTVNVIGDAVGYYSPTNLRDLDLRISDLHDRLGALKDDNAGVRVEWIAYTRSGDIRGSSPALANTTMIRPEGHPVGVFCLDFPIDGAELKDDGAVVSVQNRTSGVEAATANLTSFSGHACRGTGFDAAIDTYDHNGVHGDHGFAVHIPRAPVD
ncbi:MAG: hypothetical protein AAFY28_12010 [Actinomycetota bacterium]